MGVEERDWREELGEEKKGKTVIRLETNQLIKTNRKRKK